MANEVILTQNEIGTEIRFADGTYLSPENAIIDGNKLCVPSPDTMRMFNAALDVSRTSLGDLSVGTSKSVFVTAPVGRQLCAK